MIPLVPPYDAATALTKAPRVGLDPVLAEILACPQDKGPLYYVAEDDLLYNPRMRTVLCRRGRHSGAADRRGNRCRTQPSAGDARCPHRERRTRRPHSSHDIAARSTPRRHLPLRLAPTPSTWTRAVAKPALAAAQEAALASSEATQGANPTCGRIANVDCAWAWAVPASPVTSSRRLRAPLMPVPVTVAKGYELPGVRWSRPRLPSPSRSAATPKRRSRRPTTAHDAGASVDSRHIRRAPGRAGQASGTAPLYEVDSTIPDAAGRGGRDLCRTRSHALERAGLARPALPSWVDAAGSPAARGGAVPADGARAAA